MNKDLFPKSELLELQDQVNYSENSIVSRPVLKEPGGNVTLFAFDGGQELSEHTAPFDAMVQVLDGKAEIIIAGASHKLDRGKTIIMPAGVPHAVKAHERFKMLLTMVRKSD